MDTQNIWAKTLKTLREKNEIAILASISNIQPSFTHDEIILNIKTNAIYDLLKMNAKLFPPQVVLRPPYKNDTPPTIEQKLGKIFGDKFFVE